MSLRSMAVALIVAALWIPTLALAEVRVALLPISVHAAGPNTEYLSKGLGEMLSARLEQYEGLVVVRIGSGAGSPAGSSEAIAAAREAGADFALFGSFTRFGEGASLDLRCARVAGASERDDEDPLRRVFIQSGKVAEIIPQLDKLAEKVARHALGEGGRAHRVPETGAPDAPGNPGPGGQGAADLADLLRRVDALERAVYAPRATGEAPAKAEPSGSRVR